MIHRIYIKSDGVYYTFEHDYKDDNNRSNYHELYTCLETGIKRSLYALASREECEWQRQETIESEYIRVNFRIVDNLEGRCVWYKSSTKPGTIERGKPDSCDDTCRGHNYNCDKYREKSR